MRQREQIIQRLLMLNRKLANLPELPAAHPQHEARMIVRLFTEAQIDELEWVLLQHEGGQHASAAGL